MEKTSTVKAILGGLIATIVFSGLLYLSPYMHLPNLDVAGFIGTWNSPVVASAGSGAWWRGMIMQVIMGVVVFPLLYAQIFYSILKGGPAIRGLKYGVLVWLFASLVVLPLIGEGFFFARHAQPVAMSVVYLIGHIIYGAILGAIAGEATPSSMADYVQSRDREALRRE